MRNFIIGLVTTVLLWTASSYCYLLFQLQTRKANLMNNWQSYDVILFDLKSENCTYNCLNLTIEN